MTKAAYGSIMSQHPDTPTSPARKPPQLATQSYLDTNEYVPSSYGFKYTDTTDPVHPLISVFIIILGGAFALSANNVNELPPVKKSHPTDTISAPVTMYV